MQISSYINNLSKECKEERVKELLKIKEDKRFFCNGCSDCMWASEMTEECLLVYDLFGKEYPRMDFNDIWNKIESLGDITFAGKILKEIIFD